MEQQNISQAGIASPSGGSPRDVYLYFLLSLCREYFTQIKSADDKTIEATTAGLIAFCPDKNVRERLWHDYISNRTRYASDRNYSGNAVMSASVLAVGALVSHLNEVMEFTENSSGGFL